MRMRTRKRTHACTQNVYIFIHIIRARYPTEDGISLDAIKRYFLNTPLLPQHPEGYVAEGFLSRDHSPC